MGTHLDEKSTINEVWKRVNKMLAPRQTAKPLALEIGEDKMDDPNQVSNELNKWFKQKPEDLVKKIYCTLKLNHYPKIFQKPGLNSEK